MAEKVASLFGGPTHVREPNATAIAVLERWLEKARSGEVVGVVIAGLHYDRLAGWESGGMIGGYGLLGALLDAQNHTLRLMQDD